MLALLINVPIEVKKAEMKDHFFLKKNIQMIFFKKV